MNNPLEIPYYLAIVLFFSIIFFILINFNFKGRTQNKKWLRNCLLLFLSIYIFIIGSAFILDIYYQISLSQYDLNKNGIFEDNEQVENQKIVFSKVINNTGRNLSIFTGFIFSFIISTFVYFIGKIYKIR